jgi:hypothetical protein
MVKIVSAGYRGGGGEGESGKKKENITEKNRRLI